MFGIGVASNLERAASNKQQDTGDASGSGSGTEDYSKLLEQLKKHEGHSKKD
ncbi:MAG: hypothetical protein NVS2B14_15090 [Chamaesiphon sp.]